MSKVIAVTGATGQQGGGLVRAILADPDGGFAVRAITRTPDSDRAQELAALGAEVVQADIDDPISLERAFAGAHGAYCVTNFWEHFDAEREIIQARNLADAAKAAGVAHVIWSTLEDTRELVPLDDDRMPTLAGRFKVPHYDTKGESDATFRELGLPVTFLRTSFYWENMIAFGMGPQRMSDGSLAITFPLGDARLPAIAADDIGPVAYAIFAAGDRFVGETVSIAGEHLSGEEMAAALSRALGVEVGYNAVSPDAYRAAGFPGADDLGNMFQFKADFEDRYRGPRDVDATRALHPGLQTFAVWLERKGAQIPLPVEA
ncbi:MAG TPA: NmrA/HSCARG family protein [Capillimicrobium sp.]|nr:NmrA/HSCARG family protein [Capillimicrobium sp.]